MDNLDCFDMAVRAIDFVERADLSDLILIYLVS
jgi:hypothetical protein